MNYPKEFQMAWDIKPCRLNGDFIEEIKGLPDSVYNPFDYYRKGDKELYLQFVAVDENDPQSILKFISTYGFLGFKNDIERVHREDIDLIVDSYKKVSEAEKDAAALYIKLAAKVPDFAPLAIESLKYESKIEGSNMLSDEEYNQLVSITQLEPEKEKLEDIKQEIFVMRVLVLLWQALRANNREGVLSQLENFYLLDHPNLDGMSSFYDLENTVLWYKAAELLSRQVNRKLSGVTPFLSNMFNEESRSFAGLWYSPHLLSAMYVMFYTDLTQGVILRKCQNKTCKEFFSVYGGDERKIYCSDRCAKAHAQREYRLRKKEQAQNKVTTNDSH